MSNLYFHFDTCFISLFISSIKWAYNMGRNEKSRLFQIMSHLVHFVVVNNNKVLMYIYASLIVYFVLFSHSSLFIMIIIIILSWRQKRVDKQTDGRTHRHGWMGGRTVGQTNRYATFIYIERTLFDARMFCII